MQKTTESTENTEKNQIFYANSEFYVVGLLCARNTGTYVIIPSTLAPGSAAVFDLITPVPGKFLLVDHALWRVTKGAAGLMHVMAATKPTGCDTPLIGGGVACTDPGSWPLNLFSPITLGTGH